MEQYLTQLDKAFEHGYSIYKGMYEDYREVNFELVDIDLYIGNGATAYKQWHESTLKTFGSHLEDKHYFISPPEPAMPGIKRIGLPEKAALTCIEFHTKLSALQDIIAKHSDLGSTKAQKTQLTYQNGEMWLGNTSYKPHADIKGVLDKLWPGKGTEGSAKKYSRQSVFGDTSKEVQNQVIEDINQMLASKSFNASIKRRNKMVWLEVKS